MKKYILLCFVMWLTASCSNFLEEYSQDLSKVESYKDLDEMLIGDGYWRPNTVYREYGSYSSFDPFFMALHLMPDEVNVYRKYSGDELSIQEEFFGWITWQSQVGRQFKGSSLVAEDRDWNELYKRINIANQIIGEIDNQEVANAEEELDKIRVKGEAHFLRAFYYFTLVNMYARPYDPATAADEAGIPVKWSQDIRPDGYTSESLSGVYNAILSDLEDAREALRQTPVKNHPYRADIVAAHLLTSRVYLYMQDWQNAYNYADSVIQRKGDLEDLHAYSGGNILSRSSVETIFSMGGHILAPALQLDSRLPGFIISDEMVNLYGAPDDQSDLRRSKGIYIRQMAPQIVSGTNADPVWVFAKVDGAERYTNGITPSEISDFYLMRTSEAYLNAAEAAAHLPEKANEAVRLLKHLRGHRVDKDAADYGTGDQLIDYIRDERARELILEGHRWFDLRRYRVDAKHDYKKQIVHYYTDFHTDKEDGSYATTQYVLAAEGEDDSYTLSLPQEVIDFQNTLPYVRRPDHPGRLYDEFAGIDMGELGTEHGTLAGQAAAKIDNEEGNAKQADSKNPHYYDYYVSDYYQFRTYRTAYSAAFKKAYNEIYVESKSPWELGYEHGFAAGRKDFDNADYEGDHYWDDYNNPYDYGTEEDSEYDDGFSEGYADAWLSIAERAEKDAQRFLDFIAEGGSEKEGRDKYYHEEEYATWDEKDEYYYAWGDYLEAAGYYD